MFRAFLIEEGKSMSIIIYLKERLRHIKSKETFCDFYLFFVSYGWRHQLRPTKHQFTIAIGGFFISLTTGYSFGT